MPTHKLLLLSLLSGVLLAISWPAAGFAPLLLVAFIPLLAVEEQLIHFKNKRLIINVLIYSFPAFFIWNLLTCYWLVYASAFGASVVITVNSLLMSAVFTLFHLSRRFVFNRHAGSYLILPILWVCFEYCHLNWELAWPWLNLGNGFAAFPFLIQWYEYTGALGGSIWIWVSNILIYRMVFSGFMKFKNFKHKVVISSFYLVLIIGPVLYSLFLFNSFKESDEYADVVVVQPNIDPWNEKFETMSADAQIMKLINLSLQQINDKTDLLIGPETVLTEGVWEDHAKDNPQIIRLLSLKDSFPRLNILIGIDSYIMYSGETPPTNTAHTYPEGNNAWYDVYNTALFIDNSGTLRFYHKSKLVPGVERIPYPALFGYFERYILDLGGMSGSRGLQEERLNFVADKSVVLAPVICYESVFGEFINSSINKQANLIVIITNDGWWGDSPGYRQHFHYARLRAIESRLNVARSANTGISGFINSRGEILKASEYNQAVVLQERVALNNEVTFYSKYGDYLGRISVFVTALLFLSAFSKLILRKVTSKNKK